MKRSAAFLASLLLSSGATACPVLKMLVDRYGISDAGFLSPPPLATVNADPSLLRMTLPKSMLVSDGFEHTVFVDRKARRAWIHRAGGLQDVREWYGPVDIDAHSLEGCRDEAQARREATAAAATVAELVEGRRVAPRTP